MQDVATAHWTAAADPAHVAAYVWVVTRHEIDYLRGLRSGRSVIGPDMGWRCATGARFDRLVEFTGPDGKVNVRAKTTWAIVDRASGRPILPPEVVAPFLSPV